MKQSPYKKTIPAAVMGALVVLALGACGKKDGAGAQQGGQMPPAEVGVVSVTPTAVGMETSLPGRTSPFAVAEIRPQVGGIVLQRLFNEGGEVKAGQTLYQIDPASFRNSVESAKAALARSEATLVTARQKAERYKELVSIKAVSQQDYDDADAALKQAEADVAANRAAASTAALNLGYAAVKSPISGRIGKSSVTQGALVTASQTTALATVQQLDPIYVDVTQSVSELARLRRDLESGVLKRTGDGQASVKLVLDDGSIYSKTGKLAFTDVTVDAGTGSVSVRAVFPNPKGELLPGMFVRAKLETGVREGSILIPQQAVTRNTKGEATVMLAMPDGQFMPKVIQTEKAIGDKWLVSDGLKAGDQVIVEGLQRLRPGTVIKAVPLAAASAPAAGR
ncbi:efflux RND transporter periplasmic adaptor subunit [Uliginosibacterium paludis]|uniref:Efflux RND transporter periplasmic adaptor subunit n=1 Tax=Uliginosibacterium paludis TaxID=1615952 RepID=A0ABV2CR22_9RHOO